MYTERDKVRYVEMMWAEGLTPLPRSGSGGRPSRGLLRKWELLAEAGELPAERPRNHGAVERPKHARYPEATRKEAVRLHKLGEKRMHIARRLGIADASVISVWVDNERKRAIMSETGAVPAVRAKTRKAEDVSELNDRRTAELETELEEALLQVAVYKELMRDPKVADPANLSKRRLVGLGERLRRDYGYSLARILMFLGISESTYLYHRSRIAEGCQGAPSKLDTAVASSFAASGATYGYRRVATDLRVRGVRAPERKVRSSMVRQNLIARCSRSEKKWSSYIGEVSDAPDNLLLDKHMRHRFRADAPNELWLTDITEMKGCDGKVYLSIIVDCFDGKAVAWRTSTSPNADLANSTLADATATLSSERRPIIHSDRGGHYRWPEWIRLCNEAGLVRSMSRKGHSPDNAACEGFFGRAKVELFHSLVRAGASVAELLKAVASYMSWYNDGRLKTFKKDGKKVTCETIDGRRRRLGLAA